MTYTEQAMILRPLIEQAVESLNDDDALNAVMLFEKWEPEKDYLKDKRLSYDDKLWRVVQDHHSLAIYPPSIDTASLYTEVERPGEGDDKDHPIPYNNNMELFEGKYYSQGGVVYYCFRSTGVPVYNDLSALVELYVRVAS